MTKEQADDFLGPYKSDLRQCFDQAENQWAGVREREPEFNSDLQDRSRSSILFDLLRAAAKRIFADRDNIVMVEKRALFLITMENLITIRFKKFNQQMRPSISHTYQQTSYIYNLAIEGIPPTTYVTAGYMLDNLKTAIGSIDIIHQRGKDIAWYINLNEPVAEVEFTPVLIPQLETEVVRRVVAKTAKEKQDNKKASSD